MEYDPGIGISEDPEVYPPSDDSILLIESLDVRPGERVLEVGCGSGVVSIHCALNGCDVTSGDINPRAVALPRPARGRRGAGPVGLSRPEPHRLHLAGAGQRGGRLQPGGAGL